MVHSQCKLGSRVVYAPLRSVLSKRHWRLAPPYHYAICQNGMRAFLLSSYVVAPLIAFAHILTQIAGMDNRLEGIMENICEMY